MAAKPQAVPDLPEPEPLTGNLGWLLAQSSYALTVRLTAALESIGISPRSYCLLSQAGSGDFTQAELGRKVGLDKTTMVVTVDELEAAGLAKRRPASEDRRVRIIAVTKAGERKLARAREIVEEVQEGLLAELPARERDAFVSALNRLVSVPLAGPVHCSQPLRRRAPRS